MFCDYFILCVCEFQSLRVHEFVSWTLTVDVCLTLLQCPLE